MGQVSCLCLCGCVGARKQRVLVGLNSSDLKQNLVRGQMWCLALCQGQAESSPSPAHLPSFVMASPFSAPCQRFLSLHSSSSAACQGAPLLASGKPHLFCSLAFFSLLFWPWAIRWLQSWGLAARCPFKPIGGCRAVGELVLGAAPAGRMELLWGPEGVQSGQEGGQSWLVWCRLVQQPWQLPFWWRQQWQLPMEPLPYKKEPWCVLAVSTNWGTMLKPLFPCTLSNKLCFWQRLRSCLNAPKRQQGSHSCYYTSGAPRGWSVKPTCASGSSPLLCATVQHFTRIIGTSSGRQSLKVFAITPKYPIHQGNSEFDG